MLAYDESGRCQCEQHVGDNSEYLNELIQHSYLSISSFKQQSMGYLPVTVGCVCRVISINALESPLKREVSSDNWHCVGLKALLFG